MSKKIDIDNVDQMVTKANEMFEGVEITEEDFQEQFDNHNTNKMINMPGELRSNREIFLELGEQCNKYDPCPICFKCRVKGSHIYDKCDKCVIPICVHSDKERNLLIKRENFTQQVGKALVDNLKVLEQKHCSDKNS